MILTVGNGNAILTSIQLLLLFVRLFFFFQICWRRRWTDYSQNGFKERFEFRCAFDSYRIDRKNWIQVQCMMTFFLLFISIDAQENVFTSSEEIVSFGVKDSVVKQNTTFSKIVTVWWEYCLVCIVLYISIYISIYYIFYNRCDLILSCNPKRQIGNLQLEASILMWTTLSAW
jgi:hypothetical protein